MLEITLRGMRFHALVGILDHERTVAQPIEIDLLVRVTEESASSVVDYRVMYNIASAAVAGHTDYLEQIADRIAGAALAMHTRVQSARVAVRKPHVSFPGPLDCAEVVIDRAASAT
jgi:dihydroneopterin aldolase